MKKRLSFQLHFLLSLGIRVYTRISIPSLLQLPNSSINDHFRFYWATIQSNRRVFAGLYGEEPWVIYCMDCGISDKFKSRGSVNGASWWLCCYIFGPPKPTFGGSSWDCSRLNGRWNYFAINKIKNHLIDRLDLFGGTNGVDWLVSREEEEDWEE